MTFQSYYRANVTWVDDRIPRLDLIADMVVSFAPARVLDLGCGRGQLIKMLVARHGAEYTGLDAAPAVKTAGWAYVCGDLTAELPFADGVFDLVVAGEVIEHVPHPDDLLRQIRRVLSPGGHLVISTPNLVCWANRVLVPLGVQPLFTETSSEVALGRRARILGQGNVVQGHLKVFTSRSLQEILEREGFDVHQRSGVSFAFPPPLSIVDRLMARRVSWASGLVYVATKAMGDPVREPARVARPIPTSRPRGWPVRRRR